MYKLFIGWPESSLLMSLAYSYILLTCAGMCIVKYIQVLCRDLAAQFCYKYHVIYWQWLLEHWW